MHYFEFANRDTTLYSGGVTASINTGMDEILEVKKEVSNDGSIVQNFIEYIHKHECLITYETSYELSDMHPSLVGNRLIAKNIFNECVKRNYIDSNIIKLVKNDFSKPKKSIF